MKEKKAQQTKNYGFTLNKQSSVTLLPFNISAKIIIRLPNFV